MTSQKAYNQPFWHPTRSEYGLYPFAHEALEQKAAQLDVSIEELVRFAVLYYLADHDSGRIARRLPLLPSSDQSHSPDGLFGP